MTSSSVNRRDVAANPDIVAAARRLVPRIVAVREEAEAMRQTPPAVANAIADAGLYQMFLPRSVGGPELPPLTVFEAIYEAGTVSGAADRLALSQSAASPATTLQNEEI